MWKIKCDDEYNLLILFKLKGSYHVFSSTIYSIMDAFEDEFKIPYFEDFCDQLTREHSNLMQVDALSHSKNKSLVAHFSKGKHKYP